MTPKQKYRLSAKGVETTRLYNRTQRQDSCPRCEGSKSVVAAFCLGCRHQSTKKRAVAKTAFTLPNQLTL